MIHCTNLSPGLLLIKPYGACSHLPPPIFAAAEHWILDAYGVRIPSAQPARWSEALHSADGHLTRQICPRQGWLVGTGGNALAS